LCAFVLLPLTSVFSIAYTSSNRELNRRQPACGVSTASIVPSGNEVLDRLSLATRERLRPSLERVTLGAGRLLCDIDDGLRHLYFPVSGLVSVLGLTETGDGIELATIGHEAAVGATLSIDTVRSVHRLMVQVPGAAYRLPIAIARRELRLHDDFEQAIHLSVQRLLVDISQSAICLAFHPLPQRLCRWLLLSRERAQANPLMLTQDFIAQMLGVTRANVSRALRALEHRRLVHQGHGRIHIIDLRALEQASCECYRIQRQRVRTLSLVS